MFRILRAALLLSLLAPTCVAVAGVLPRDGDASANWKMAGMLSVGGIPNRSTVCATVTPLGAGKDDTGAIQGAIESCPNGEVVSLSAGTFTIAEGNYLLIHKAVTLRGAGPGVTVLTRKGGAKLGSDLPGKNPSPMIILGPQRYNNFTTPTALTADVKHGGYSVQVASAHGFSVGQVVLLDEASGAGWQNDVEGLGQIWASPDYRVVWQKHNPTQEYHRRFRRGRISLSAGHGRMLVLQLRPAHRRDAPHRRDFRKHHHVRLARNDFVSRESSGTALRVPDCAHRTGRD